MLSMLTCPRADAHLPARCPRFAALQACPQAPAFLKRPPILTGKPAGSVVLVMSVIFVILVTFTPAFCPVILVILVILVIAQRGPTRGPAA